MKLRKARVISFTLIGLFLFVLSYSLLTFRGGQISDSDDGKFRIITSEYTARMLDHYYYIEVVDRTSNRIIQRIKIEKGDATTTQLRGAERVVTWNEEDHYADISLPQSLKFRIYLPE